MSGDNYPQNEFIQDDINIIASDTCRLYRDTLVLIGACDGMELTTAHLTLFLIEIGGNSFHAA